MKKTILILAVICAFNYINAQNNYEITYHYYITPDNNADIPFIKAKLYYTDTMQIFELLNEEVKEQIIQGENDKGGMSFRKMSPGENDYYIDSTKRAIKYRFITCDKDRVCITEKKVCFDWKLLKRTKKILGYKCKAAKVNFRGSEYIAYYAPDIPINSGPWVFKGLPGIIMEISSTDKVIKFTTNELKINPEEFSFPEYTLIENKYTLEEFRKKVHSILIKKIKFHKSLAAEYGGGATPEVHFNFRSVDIIVKDDDY